MLCDPQWRVGTSTPLADPSGDYAQQLFDHLERLLPGQGSALRNRAVALVGGPDSAPIPAGRLAAEYLIAESQADIFLGYASYADALAACPQVKVRMLPATLDLKVTYGLCLLGEGCVVAEELVAFILGAQGQRIFQQMGMLSLN